MIKRQSILGFPGWIKIEEANNRHCVYRNLKTGQDYLFHPEILARAMVTKLSQSLLTTKSKKDQLRLKALRATLIK